MMTTPFFASARKQYQRDNGGSEHEATAGESTAEPAPLGIGLGDFLAQTFPEPEPYIDGILSDDGGGWLGGEEKLGKTYYALEEALCLALGLDVCGRFKVPTRRRVLFIEEEDPPRRTHRRLRALLRGHEHDPDDPAFRIELNGWFRLSVWAGFTLDDDTMVARLGATLGDFQPTVIYLDVLRKITLRDLNKAAEASALVGVLEAFRRSHGATFRVLHHYRKSQGFRTGRGSQEIGGSFVLGAWGENSLFFEPVGRKQGAVRIEVQTKDNAPVPGFTLTIESEGPPHAPDLVRLVAKEEVDPHAADEVVFQAVAALPKQDAVKGAPGVSLDALIAATKLGNSTVRRALKNLIDLDRCLVTGTMSKQAKLYGVNGK
jgi:AAA domain-containing protein